MSEREPQIDEKFAKRVDWNLLRTFVDIVRAGGIGAAGPAAQQATAEHTAPRSSGLKTM